jgi:BlaI family penicillinase repressor
MPRRPRKTLPKERLSPSEWEIMRICWRLGRCTVREVLREDLKSHRRDYRTILTFMTRMARKGWLDVEKVGNTNRYSPAIPRKKAVTREVRRFLDEVVGPEPENLEVLRRELRALGRGRQPTLGSN